MAREASPMRAARGCAAKYSDPAEPAGFHRPQQLEKLLRVGGNHDRMAVEHEVLRGHAGRQVPARDVRERNRHAPHVPLRSDADEALANLMNARVGPRLREQSDAMLPRPGRRGR